MPLPDCSVNAGRMHTQPLRNKSRIDHIFLSAFLLQLIAVTKGAIAFD